jgi:hypothetical protein
MAAHRAEPAFDVAREVGQTVASVATHELLDLETSLPTFHAHDQNCTWSSNCCARVGTELLCDAQHQLTDDLVALLEPPRDVVERLGTVIFCAATCASISTDGTQAPA